MTEELVEWGQSLHLHTDLESDLDLQALLWHRDIQSRTPASLPVPPTWGFTSDGVLDPHQGDLCYCFEGVSSEPVKTFQLPNRTLRSCMWKSG